MATYKELVAQRDQLDAQIEKAKATERAKVIAEVREKIEAFDLTARDLGIAIRRRTKPKPEAVYQDPKTGAVWSGRGREPGWIKGKDRNRFLIK
ncbi:H-NS histone family protein [Pandoraea communis]|uniref:H-NS histone family protein n=1 Tax=Pandoraea communis TaxID=2508297 RepID=UPI0025A53C32|nr:H-NS histone family protein [Pandoraea communis]MDM8356549.1 H-NS histone family protein [Pandoraea communis]